VNVLLCYPACPQSYWSFHYALRFVRKRATYPPLGLITVAAMLPATWQKKLVDINVTPLRDSDIAWADYVFISAMDIQRDSAREVVARCRALGVKTAAGGPLFTCGYEAFPEIDHILCGEGELTVPAFLADLAAGIPKRIYEAEGWADLRDTPAPLWELVDMRQYTGMNIQYSRGCPYDCEFCSVTALFGHRPRCKSADQVLCELSALYEAGWRGSVFFVDDNFIGNKRKLKEELLPALIRWMEERRYPFSFSTEASINLADDDGLMEMMVRAGFEMVFVGIETPHEQSLTECNKVQNKGRDLLASVKRIQASGLEVQGGFIVGFDSDDTPVFTSIIDFIQKSGIVSAMVGLLNAPKGTRLYRRLKQEDRLLPEYTGDNTGLSINFIPRMGKNRLLAGYKGIIDTIYSPRHYYQRVMGFLREYRPPKAKGGRIRPHHIAAALRSVIRLGILSKERRYYWRTVLWSLCRPRLLPYAIKYAIYGYHYHRVYRDLSPDMNRPSYG
jgi:radical SAM superfamily enzyme YgiQ (UPF0313 family)